MFWRSTMKSDTIDSPLHKLIFDNAFTRDLPGDPHIANFRRQVPSACYSHVRPQKVPSPQLAAYSKEAAALLDLPETVCNTDLFTQVFSGNRLLPGMDPYAMCYGGHQFGNWAGQLGDGRAINLGEVINRQSQRWILQLKGAGPTPYSRNADGLAVLRSSLREFLCSEAMHHLGVPTTRALSLILTGDSVERDMFYDGHPKEEPGAVVCRMAPSFTRFGNFQLFSFRDEIPLLRKFLDYTIRTDFPHLDGPLFSSQSVMTHPDELSYDPDVVVDSSSKALYLTWFKEVCRRTADMIVHWMRVGFVHGVMNTDNMSILGLTIDYGPYGWLENYDPDWTPNTTDAAGRRYRFGNQANIAHWNLAQLANAIYPLIGSVDPLQDALMTYSDRLKNEWQRMMADKLGLKAFNPATDDDLSRELFELLAMVETDMTLFFRALGRVSFKKNATGSRHDTPASMIAFPDGSSVSITEHEVTRPFMATYYAPDTLDDTYRVRLKRWIKNYSARILQDGTPHGERQEKMHHVNPKYVLRNYLAQLAIDQSEKGDYNMIHELLEVLRHPYDTQPRYEKYAEKRPEWARHRPGCSMLSCSS